MIIDENIVRANLLRLRTELDEMRPTNYARLPNRNEELFWLIAERFFPQVIEELFPDWVALPAGTAFCLERKSRRN